MPTAYLITPETLCKFQEPFGRLIQGKPAETMKELKNILQNQKPSTIISVGDTVSRNLHKHGLIPQLSITDNKSMRRKLRPEVFPLKNLVHIKNPQGRITEEAIKAIQDALESTQPTHILVDGEEDLLTLVAVLYSPKNALVVYGQPNKGLVVVNVTHKKREEAQKILKSMKTIQEK